MFIVLFSLTKITLTRKLGNIIVLAVSPSRLQNFVVKNDRKDMLEGCGH